MLHLAIFAGFAMAGMKKGIQSNFLVKALTMSPICSRILSMLYYAPPVNGALKAPLFAF
jgi:hypothetical protein